MKTYFYSLFFLFLCGKTMAQEGQTYAFDLKNPSDLKQIRIVSTDDFDVVYVNTNDLSFTDAPFIAASIRLEGQRLDEHMVVQINARDVSKNVINYINVHRFHENEEDPTQLFVSELAYLDKTTAHIQFVFKIEKPALEKLNKIQVRLFNPTNLPPVKQASLSPQGACDAPPSVSRSVWGANLGLNNNTQYKNTPAFAPVSHLIVHHSAGGNTSTNWSATVLSIFDFHVNSNGWSDVGYNYLITPDGALYYGRGGGNNVIGAHYCSKNTNTMGVCMVGTYTAVAPTDTAWRTLERIFSWKAFESNINPTDSKILSDLGSIPVINGHRSGCATECPGDSSFNRLPALRLRLASIVNACRSVSTTDLKGIGKITLSPNPVTNGQIVVSADLEASEKLTIKAFDALGRQVFEKQIGEKGLSYTTELDVSHLSKGIYFVQINFGKTVTMQKIVVE